MTWEIKVHLFQTDQGLDAGEDGRHVVGRGPAVLEDVQTDSAVSVDVGVEHLQSSVQLE